MVFLSGWLQSTDAAPDDGFAAAIVPVDSAEHFTAFAANDNLCKAVVAFHIVLRNNAIVLDSGLVQEV